jgi:hypothetical protein
MYAAAVVAALGDARNERSALEPPGDLLVDADLRALHDAAALQGLRAPGGPG